MDQKHAMLYPPLEPGGRNGMSQDQRISASAAIGLPTEAPPSYDMAMAAGPSSSKSAAMAIAQAAEPVWMPSAPVVPTDGTRIAQPQAPIQFSGSSTSTAPTAASISTSTVIVQQPRMQHQVPLPTQQLRTPTVVTVDVPPTTTTTTTTTRVITAAMPPKLGPNPCAVTCPSCGTNRTTRMSYTPNARTHMCALLLCLVGWCCCACCVPYLMNSCRTGNHYCSKCNAFLGTYNPHDRK